MATGNLPEQEPPSDIVGRLKAWHGLWWWSAVYHYALGVLGVACSAVAATDVPHVRQAAATLAAVCFAVIGFVNPQRRYLKFVRAWRTLDSACRRFRHSNLPIEYLLDAVDRGEQIITEIEQDTAWPQKKAGEEPDPNAAPRRP